MGQVHRLGSHAGLPPVVEGGDLGDVAEPVAHQVDHVDGVLHEGTAALLVAACPPADGPAAVEQLHLGVARGPGCQALGDDRGRRAVAAVEADLGYDAGPLDGGGEPHGLGHVEAHRLLHEEVQAALGGEPHLVGVQSRRQVDVHGVEGLALQHALVIGVDRLGAEGGGLLPARFLVEVAEGGELRLPRLDQGLQGRQVGALGDEPHADESQSHGCGHQASSIRRISSASKGPASEAATEPSSSATLSTPERIVPTRGSDSR